MIAPFGFLAPIKKRIFPTNGRIYNQYAINNALFAPDNWRLPTPEEQTTLQTFAGGSSIAGTALKSIGLQYWNSPNAGTDAYNMAVYGSGRRNSSGDFFDLKNYGYLIGSSASYMTFNNSSSSMSINTSTNQNEGYSVRLIWDGVGTPGATFVDKDRNVYDVVNIGTQYWLKQNWACTKLKNGSSIANITDNATWAADITGAYCNYNNDVNNVYI